MPTPPSPWKSTRLAALIVAGAGVVSIVLAPFIGESVSDNLWAVEPLAYIGAVLIIVSLAAALLFHALAQRGDGITGQRAGGGSAEQWSEITQRYFEVFHHDLGRPLSRIVGKERELRAVLRSQSRDIEPGVSDLLDEIERQAPNFRLMMSNIQVLIQMEAEPVPPRADAVELTEVVRKIVERYNPVAEDAGKQITWWSEPPEFGLVYSDGSGIEHIVTNLLDNAVRFAATQAEVRITRNPSHFFVRVWDDGPGIAAQYVQHLFDRSWTPETARREEKEGSGLGLFIARSLATR